MKKIFIVLAAISGYNANAQSWDITGNGNTNPDTNYLGTSNLKSLIFKTNNIERLKINEHGRLIYRNTNDNILITGGNDTMTGNSNFAFGVGALSSNTLGTLNTAVGMNSLLNNTSGNYNTGYGVNSLLNNLEGSLNTAVGFNALNGQGLINENVALGQAAMSRYNAVATDVISKNTAIGTASIANIRNGNSNSALGKISLRALITGNNNIGIGENAGINFVNGDNNIFIGNFTSAYSSTANNELNINNWIVGNNGTIGIGQFTNQLPADGISQDGQKYKLFVKDGIRTEKVKVDIAASNGWADYVFEKDYKLMPLSDLSKFIAEKGHLPEVPTTEEAIKNGIELKEMNILLLKKIEELTLHAIEQQKRIEALENKMK